MRPPGEIRQAVRSAWDDALRRATGPMPATWRDVAGALVPRGVGRGAVRNTVKNMARAGHLRPMGQVRVPGSPRPLVAYLPADLVPAAERSGDPGLVLAAVTRSWAGAT